jgi:hypothetical protein
MKKLILAAAAASSLFVGFAAHADADCQAGSTWGTKPGCSAAVDAQAQIYGPGVYNLPGGSVEAQGGQNYGYYGYGAPYALGQILGNNRGYDRGYVQSPYPRTNRDRDGDGIRNNRDRHPDDPRYR